MNQDTFTIDLELAQVRDARVDDIAASPSNPRKRFEDIAELAESVLEVGILQPLLVRPHPDPSTGRRFELVAGERRLRAARRAELELVPVVVRNLDDAAVLELQLVENNQRRDVTPLEEADAMLALTQRHGRTPADIADRLGRPVDYVRRRLALVDLVPALRERLDAGDIGLGSALRLSRLPEDAQDEIAQQRLTRPPFGTWEIDNAIGAVSRRLDDAPWALYEHIGGRPTCIGCPDRAGAQPDLFDLGPDRCLDRHCWAAKLSVWKAEQAEAARSRGVRVLEGDEAADVARHLGAYQGEWVRLTDQVWALGNMPWGEVMPEGTPTALVFDERRQEFVEIVERATILERLEQHGQTDVLDTISGRKVEREREEAERERRRLEDEKRQVVEDLADRIESEGVLPVWLMRGLVHAVLHMLDSDWRYRDVVERPLERRGVELADEEDDDDHQYEPETRALLAALEHMSFGEVAGLLVELTARFATERAKFPSEHIQAWHARAASESEEAPEPAEAPQPTLGPLASAHKALEEIEYLARYDYETDGLTADTVMLEIARLARAARTGEVSNG